MILYHEGSNGQGAHGKIQKRDHWIVSPVVILDGIQPGSDVIKATFW